jgi:predicted ATP-grasp superfamily ATP-dependent carboligase
LERLGVPHAESLHLHEEKDLLKFAETHELKNFFFKPRNSQRFFQRFQVKGYFVRDLDQALCYFREIHKEGLEVILQEFIPGPPENHYYVEGYIDRDYRVRCLFARRRLRMYPPKLGNSTAMMSVDLDLVENARKSLMHLMREVKFRGIFSAEFKLDPRDGVFKIIEVNIRPWWYIEFAARSGVNVAAMAYYDALNLEMPEIPAYRKGAISVNLYTDWHVFRQDHRKMLQKIPPFVRDWLFAQYTVFSWKDPLPAAVWFRDMLKRRTEALTGLPLAVMRQMTRMTSRT